MGDKKQKPAAPDWDEIHTHFTETEQEAERDAATVDYSFDTEKDTEFNWDSYDGYIEKGESREDAAFYSANIASFDALKFNKQWGKGLIDKEAFGEYASKGRNEYETSLVRLQKGIYDSEAVTALRDVVWKFIGE